MSKMITSLLVANRGEIARRVFRTARELGITTVAVFSDADSDAPFVRDADLAVRLPGASPAETYLRGDLIVAAALKAGADAVHPGYGFLSENAAFARAVVDAGLTWVGPTPEAIEAMGSKIEAKALMAAAGVPVLPSGSAEDTGFPLLVKASFGGGGRGMRIVRTAEDLPEALAGAEREAASAFGDGTVFCERLLERARHVEVQVFGDQHGTVVALHERECSVQRRHQKVVEEAPSPAVSAELRERMAEAAVTAARTLGYVGAGTVEFLLDGDEFFFLEVNTRLQVEHPVTEAVTGLDLVRLQLEVAQGARLPEVPELSGHAIEVRLYAEDPARDWLPQSGVLSTFEVPHRETFGWTGHGVRLDSGVESGSEVGVHYDPMLAKVIAWGASREVAARALSGALLRSRLHGLTTNRDLLVRILRSPEFLAGETDTGFLDRFDLEPALVSDRRPHLVAAALALAAAHRAGAPVLGGLPSGWRNNPTQPQRTAFVEGEVTYGQTFAVDGAPVGVVVVSASPAAVLLEVDGLLLSCAVAREGSNVHVDSAFGGTTHELLDRFPDPSANVAPGSLTAGMPGTVTRVAVSDGETVEAGQVLLVLEAMKMEHPVVAPAAGTVSGLSVQPGDQVATGQVLAVVVA